MQPIDSQLLTGTDFNRGLCKIFDNLLTFETFKAKTKIAYFRIWTWNILSKNYGKLSLNPDSN